MIIRQIFSKFNGILLRFRVASGAKVWKNFVDLEKRWKMNIWSQKSALIQLRTDHLKLADRWHDLRNLRSQNHRTRGWGPRSQPSCLGSPGTTGSFRGPLQWTSEGPFSAVSTPIFSTKYLFSAFFEIYTIFTLSHRSKFKILGKFRQFLLKVWRNLTISAKIYSFFF